MVGQLIELLSTLEVSNKQLRLLLERDNGSEGESVVLRLS